MKVRWNKFFFSKLQLTYNISQFRKFHLKMLKNHQDIAFFVDPFKFKLHESLKRTDVRNVSFVLSVHLFVFDLCDVKSSFTKILCCVTLYCVLCYMTLHYKFNDQRFIYRSKRHAQSVCILNKKEWFFQMKIKWSFKMITKKKTGRLTKFGRTIHPKNRIISLWSAYWKNSDKLVQ